MEVFEKITVTSAHVKNIVFELQIWKQKEFVWEIIRMAHLKGQFGAIV